MSPEIMPARRTAAETMPTWSIIMRWALVLAIGGGGGIAGYSAIQRFGGNGITATEPNALLDANQEQRITAIEQEMERRRTIIERIPVIEANQQQVLRRLDSIDIQMVGIRSSIDRLLGGLDRGHYTRGDREPVDKK